LVSTFIQSHANLAADNAAVSPDAPDH